MSRYEALMCACDFLLERYKAALDDFHAAPSAVTQAEENKLSDAYHIVRSVAYTFRYDEDEEKEVG